MPEGASKEQLAIDLRVKIQHAETQLRIGQQERHRPVEAGQSNSARHPRGLHLMPGPRAPRVKLSRPVNEIQNSSVIGGIGVATLPLNGPEWIRQQGLLECLGGVCRCSIRVSTKPVQEVEGILRRELEDFLQLRVALLLIGLQHHVHVAIQHVQGINVQRHAIVQAKKHLGQQVEHLQNVFVPRTFG